MTLSLPEHSVVASEPIAPSPALNTMLSLQKSFMTYSASWKLLFLDVEE
jgi:hypothetical protein